MRFFSNAVRCGWLLAVCLVSPPLAANVVIANTRVVFPADQSEVTVKLSNVGSTPSLVQAWVDDGRPQARVQDLQVPFDVMPAMFRLDAGKGQSLRLFHGGEAMPADRESLYWLNVLDVPPRVRVMPCRWRRAHASNCCIGRQGCRGRPLMPTAESPGSCCVKASNGC